MTRLLTRFSRFGQQRFRSSLSSASALDDDVSEVKPYSKIPGPRGIGNLLKVARSRERLHELQLENRQTYGPIYKQTMGLTEFVFLSDIDAIAQLLRQEGKYPYRLDISVLQAFRDKAGHAQGVFQASGEDWHRMRRVVNQPMMKLKSVEHFLGGFNTVAADFIERLARKRDGNNIIPDIEKEFFNWSLESIGTMLYERRLGCIADQPSPESQRFIEAVNEVIELLNYLIFLPATFTRIFLPRTWKKFCHGNDTVFSVSMKCVDEKIEEIKKNPSQDGSMGFIEYLISQNLSPKEVYANVNDSMAAAIDTTSITTLFVLNQLSQNPRIQERLYEEIEGAVPPGDQPTAANLQHMPYLKAVIKETMRMYPVANMLTRKLKNDAVILGYHLPKETTIVMSLFTLGRLSTVYGDPDNFRPERWLRDRPANEEKINHFAFLPFGFGTRMCIGRRVAEMEMQLLISQIVRRFQIAPVVEEEMKTKTSLLLIPKDPVQLRFQER